MEGGNKIVLETKSTKAENPLVSIITVVLNGEKYLEQTIESVLAQSYKNIEYIIIDGNSTDNTLNIIKKYNDEINYWVSDKDGGIYFAMNKGIALAKGNLIGIINSDDYFSNNTVDLIVKKYLETNADIYHGDIILLNGEIETRMKPEPTKMFQQPSIFHPTCFVKASVYKAIGSFDTTYKISADYDFLLRCINNKYQFKYIPEVLTYFRPGGMSASCASNLEGYKIMKVHKTGYHKAVAWRTLKCYIKTFLKKLIHLKHT